MREKTDRHVDKHRAQVIAAMVVLVVGCTMVLAGLMLPPKGEIHPSVLVGFGEALTFAGAVFGVKYYADFKAYMHELMKEAEKEDPEK